MDFVHFWTAYEDVVRKARANKLTVEDFQGTTISLTNPGSIGTVHSVPAPHGGPGRHHRRRRARLPRRVAGREQRDAQPQRRQQDPHAHLDLRPPDHPGRPERRLPADHPPAAARRATASTTRSSSRCASPTSRSAGSRTSTPRTTTTSTRSPASRSSSTPTACAATSWPTPTRSSTGSAATPTSTSPRHGLTPLGPRPHLRHRRLRRRAVPQAAQDPRHPARLVLPHRRHRVHAHPGPRPAQVDPGQGRAALREGQPATSRCGSCAASTPPRPSRPSCRRSSSGRSASRSRAASRSSRCSTASCAAPPTTASTRSASACRTAAASTCSPTSPASPTARSSASSRASRTPSRSRAPVT